jgi:hypothetical protein
LEDIYLDVELLSGVRRDDPKFWNAAWGVFVRYIPPPLKDLQRQIEWRRDLLASPEHPPLECRRDVRLKGLAGYKHLDATKYPTIRSFLSTHRLPLNRGYFTHKGIVVGLEGSLSGYTVDDVLTFHPHKLSLAGIPGHITIDLFKYGTLNAFLRSIGFPSNNGYFTHAGKRIEREQSLSGYGVEDVITFHPVGQGGSDRLWSYDDLYEEEEFDSGENPLLIAAREQINAADIAARTYTLDTIPDIPGHRRVIEMLSRTEWAVIGSMSIQPYHEMVIVNLVREMHLFRSRREFVVIVGCASDDEFDFEIENYAIISKRYTPNQWVIDIGENDAWARAFPRHLPVLVDADDSSDQETEQFLLGPIAPRERYDDPEVASDLNGSNGEWTNTDDVPGLYSQKRVRQAESRYATLVEPLYPAVPDGKAARPAGKPRFTVVNPAGSKTAVRPLVRISDMLAPKGATSSVETEPASKPTPPDLAKLQQTLSEGPTLGAVEAPKVVEHFPQVAVSVPFLPPRLWGDPATEFAAARRTIIRRLLGWGVKIPPTTSKQNAWFDISRAMKIRAATLKPAPRVSTFHCYLLELAGPVADMKAQTLGELRSTHHLIRLRSHKRKSCLDWFKKSARARAISLLGVDTNLDCSVFHLLVKPAYDWWYNTREEPVRVLKADETVYRMRYHAKPKPTTFLGLCGIKQDAPEGVYRGITDRVLFSHDDFEIGEDPGAGKRSSYLDALGYTRSRDVVINKKLMDMILETRASARVTDDTPGAIMAHAIQHCRVLKLPVDRVVMNTSAAAYQVLVSMKGFQGQTAMTGSKELPKVLW